ncbi:MAG: hypothetical protein AAGA22_04920 [Pseudomonadota bacterium]
MTIASNQSSLETKHQLHKEVNEAASAARSAYAELLACFPGSGDRPVALQRSLGVNKKLAWQVFRVATAHSPLNAGVAVPGISASTQVANAAKKQGVPDAVAERIMTSTQEFHDAVERHAEDRSVFELMVRSVTGEGIENYELDLKRTAFRANRELLGKCAEVSLSSLVIVPGREEGKYDLTLVRGLHDLRRLRPTVPLQIAYHKFSETEELFPREPISEDDALDEGLPASLLAEYGSQPTPKIRHVHSRAGAIRSFAETEGLGNSSLTTCFLGSVARNVSELGGLNHVVEVSTPSRLLIHDFFVDERLVGQNEPDFCVMSRPADTDLWPGDDPSVVLPGHEQVSFICVGLSSIATPSLPRYTEMMNDVVGRLGWEAERLRLYRTMIEYPILNSVVWTRFDIDTEQD